MSPVIYNTLTVPMEAKRQLNRQLVFPDFPDFRPNLTPREIFDLGSFGGTYWRPIKSDVTKATHHDAYLAYPPAWFAGIPKTHLVTPWSEYDKSINAYGVRVGTTLEFWESKGWMRKTHPYGWVQWYCGFFAGDRGPDDQRQVKRWIQTAGPNSRFRLALSNLIRAKGKTYSDITVSPKRRQTLQHWAYRLTAEDYRAANKKSLKKNPKKNPKKSLKKSPKKSLKKSPKKSPKKK
jgi:hypothetical protein